MLCKKVDEQPINIVMGAHKNFFTEEQRLREMASAESEPITRVWGQSPQRGPGAEALVKGQGKSSPEAESFEAFVP